MLDFQALSPEFIVGVVNPRKTIAIHRLYPFRNEFRTDGPLVPIASLFS